MTARIYDLSPDGYEGYPVSGDSITSFMGRKQEVEEGTLWERLNGDPLTCLQSDAFNGSCGEPATVQRDDRPMCLFHADWHDWAEAHQSDETEEDEL